MKTRYEKVCDKIDDNIKAGKSDLECSYGYCKALLEGMEAVEKVKDKQMTVEFNGTVEKLAPFYDRNDAARLLGALEALGLIKFKEEKKPLFKNDDIRLNWDEQQNAYVVYHRGKDTWFAK
jgi:hypothetical protein